MLFTRENEENRKLPYIAIIILLIGILVALFLWFSVWFRKDKKMENSLPENAPTFFQEQEVSEDKQVGNDESDSSVSTEEITADEEVEVLSSENYRITDVRFGGIVAAASGNDEGVPLEILEIKGNTVSSSNKKDNKILITWKTNKMALSTVEYAKNDSLATMKFTETGFGFSHGIVLSGLEPGTRYVYSIKSKDRWGNEKNSEKYAVYISSPTGSIVDIITKEFNGIFGWMKK